MVSLISLSLTVALGASAAKPTPADVAEAVFNHQLARLDDSMVYCLSVDGKDASTEFIGRLKKGKHSVVKKSACKQVLNTNVGSYHLETKRKALFLGIGQFREGEEGFVYVDFSTYHHGLWGSEETFALKLVSGKWIVFKAELNYVS